MCWARSASNISWTRNYTPQHSGKPIQLEKEENWEELFGRAQSINCSSICEREKTRLFQLICLLSSNLNLSKFIKNLYIRIICLSLVHKLQLKQRRGIPSEFINIFPIQTFFNSSKLKSIWIICLSLVHKLELNLQGLDVFCSREFVLIARRTTVKRCKQAEIIIIITIIIIIIIITLSTYLIDEQCISGLIGGATDTKVMPTRHPSRQGEANLRSYCTFEDAAKCYSESILLIFMLILNEVSSQEGSKFETLLHLWSVWDAAMRKSYTYSESILGILMLKLIVNGC